MKLLTYPKQTLLLTYPTTSAAPKANVWGFLRTFSRSFGINVR